MNGMPAKSIRPAVLLAVALAARIGASADPGWYGVVFRGADPLRVRLIGEDGTCYLLEYEGRSLRVPKKDVVKLEPVTAEPKDPDPEAASGKPAPAARGTAGAADPEAIRAAVEGMYSPDPGTVDRSCAFLSAHIADARPHLHVALGRQNPQVRLLAVKILGESGTEKDDLEAVSGRLKDDHGPVRRAAIAALRHLGPRAVPALARSLVTEPEAGNRKMAIQILRDWNDLRAVVPLVELLTAEKDEAVKLLAVSALESLTGQTIGADAPAWWAYVAEEKHRQEMKGILPAVAVPEKGRPSPGKDRSGPPAGGGRP